MATIKLNDALRMYATGPWLRAALIGAIICSAVGPALGAVIVVFPLATIKQASARDALITIAALPVYWIFAVIPTGPAGFIFGALGASWIRFRSRAVHASTRLQLESAFLGAVLGGTVPITTLVWGWGPRENVLSAVPAGAASGLICGLLVAHTLRKRGLLFVAISTSSDQPP